MFSRPEAKETESDLLRFQEQFIADRLNPSATVVRSNTREEPRTSCAGDKRDSPCRTQVERDVVTLDGLPAVQPSSRSDSDFPPKKRSRFKTRHQDAHNKGQEDGEDMDSAELLDIHDKHVTTVLSQIKEREIPYVGVMNPKVSERGFPMVLHRGNVDEQAFSSKGTNSKERKSLFAKQFAASGAVTFGVPKHQNLELQCTEDKREVVKLDSSTAKFSKPSLISGEGLQQHAGKKILLNKEVEEIHNENVAKLESMTQEEILEEQARIKASLDPSLVAFLTSRYQTSKAKITEPASGKGVDSSDIENPCEEGKSSHDEKHVHFSDDVEMITLTNGQERRLAEHTDGVGIKIGDVKVSSEWLHMGTVESEKLQWMKDCSTPSAVESKQGNQARFDFNGYLVSKTDKIPEYLGLHHHGDDPSSPGYTLEELFILARSSFLQQRVFALQVLARIIRQDQMGAFQGHLQGNVLSVLLDAGVLFLLRWSLDNTSDGVVAAAIQGFAAILIVPRDKELANKVFSFPRGQELPALCPVIETKDKKQSSEDEEKRLTDAEQLKQDIIKGLIQMSILPRLRYILEVCYPGAPAVHDVLDILTRIAQHSTQSANEVLRCPRLMEAIFANFLPLSWKASELKSGIVHGQPVAAAMRLARAVCCAGRHMAATLISKYNLTDRLMRYTALSPGSMQLELHEAYSIYTESLRTWRVCILYGLGCNAVREMYSTFIEHLQSIQCLSILMVTPDHKPEVSCAAAMVGVIEATMHAAGATADETAPEQHHGKDSLPPLAFNWSHVTGFLPLIGGCLSKWVKEILDCDPSPTLQAENLGLLSGAVTALTAYYSKSCSQVSFSPVDTLQQLEHLTNTVLLPLVESKFLDWCFAQIRSSSAFNKKRESKLSRKFIPSLPDFGSLEVIEKARTHPAESSIPELLGFTSSLMHLLFQVTKLHKGIADKFLSIVSKSAVLEYLNIVVESKDVPLSFFARQEHHLQYFLLKLANNLIEVTDLGEISSHVSLWHQTALSLFSKIFPGDEFYAFDLLSTILLNAKYVCKGNGPSSLGVTKELSEMSLSTPPLPSTCDATAASRGELIAQAHKNLPYIRSTFMRSFQGLKYPLETSRSLSLHQVCNIQSFLVPFSAGPLLPADWMFLPIVDLHNQAISVELKGKRIETITDPAVSIVTANLQLVLLLEEWRPLCLRHVSMASRIARLMCVFLTGSDLFLNSSVHDNLSALLRVYTSPPKLGQLDFNSPIPGLTSFYDLYASFLSQYSAVSFGDALFGCFVILPLAQRHDAKFRRAVWDEHIAVLRALSIPLEQMPIPLEEFLYPIEQNQALLALYLRALATQTVRLQWSPLFYLVAVHHLNAFIFQRVDPEDDHGLKKKITFLKQVLAVQNENVRHDVVYYYKPAPSNSLRPFEKFTNLPADRQLLLRSRDDLEESRRIYQTMDST